MTSANTANKLKLSQSNLLQRKASESYQNIQWVDTMPLPKGVGEETPDEQSNLETPRTLARSLALDHGMTPLYATQTGGTVGRSLANFVSLVEPTAVVVEKTAFLDGVNDDDHIEQFTANEPWNDNFQHAQMQPTISAPEIELLKWTIHCSTEQLPLIKSVLERYKDRFKTTVDAKPADLPTFDIVFNLEQWDTITSNMSYI
jgi:hypothetical protein